MSDRTVGVLVVGAGAAGSACARELRFRGYDGSVLVAGRDPDPPYDRPAVSKGLLRGEVTREETFLEGLPDDVELLTRVSAMKLDTEAREVKLSNGEVVGYERGLVLCTGANVRRLRVDGAALEGIHYLRAPGNAEALREELRPGSRVVLVGGSFIACEVAAGLAAMGMRPTMVMLEEQPLATAFGDLVGAWVADQLRFRGVELVCGDGLERFEGEDRVQRVVTASGRVVDADVVVMGTGAVPDVMLARAGGLELGESGGVGCDSRLAASAPGVWAAGDSCEYDSVLHGRRLRIEHWEVALAQGRHVARNVLGAEEDFAEVPYFWTDLADWATLEYVGPAERWDREVVRGSLHDGDFTVFYGHGDRCVAALTCGRSADLDEASRLLRTGGALPEA